MSDKWHDQLPDDSPLALEYASLKQALTTSEAARAVWNKLHECDCDDMVGHDDYCVNTLVDARAERDIERAARETAELDAESFKQASAAWAESHQKIRADLATADTRIRELTEAYVADVDWLMGVIRRLEAFAQIHHWQSDVDDILHGTEIRARANEYRAAILNRSSAEGES